MDPMPLFQQLGISLLLGLLVGLQRQRSDSEVAGIRTFPLITIFGTLSTILSQTMQSPWIPAAGIVALMGLLAIGNLPKIHAKQGSTGITTEIAALVMFVVGAMVVVGPWSVAVATGCGVAILLYLKPQMHGFAAKLGDEDFRAIIQFLLVTFIILPVVPNESYNLLQLLKPIWPQLGGDEFRVFNPHETWLMVVLVVSISLGGYLLYKWLGQRAGVLLGGILGGTISSTATTVSFSRRSASTPDLASLSAVAIMIATTVSFFRVLLEIGVAAPGFMPVAAPPLAILGGTSCVLALIAWMTSQGESTEMPSQENPTEIKSALVFGAVFAAITLAVALGNAYLRDEGLYAIAALAGMTDIDAITLSTSRLVDAGRLEATVGWRLVITAALSNLVFKGILVAAIGPRRLLGRIAVLFGLSLVTGVVLLLLWD